MWNKSLKRIKDSFIVGKEEEKKCYFIILKLHVLKMYVFIIDI